MPKVEIEIGANQFELLKSVAEAVGVSVETLVKQECVEAINSACCWVERAQL